MPNNPAAVAELRRRAEARLSGQPKGLRSKTAKEKSEADPARVRHELEVHQIELEMQNAELQKARDELEVALEKYTDLYDFAPVGYLSVDEAGVILEANLTSAVLLGVERSRLINRRLPLLVAPTSRPVLLAFLNKVLSAPTNQVCEALVLKEGGGTFWAGFRATLAVSLERTRKWCRVAFGDISARKQAEKAQRRLEILANTNRVLNHEIARRQKVEEALAKSQRHLSRLLRQSRQMQEQLRHLSHQILHVQEEERKRISRELHDQIAQTLVGINVQLAALTREAAGNPRGLPKKIAQTQRLVEESVNVVHRFARELRPTALDDLGLVPALLSFMKGFTKRTGIHVRFTTFTSTRIRQLNSATRTVFYRVAQEALTNVARHAQASLVEVNFERLPDGLGMGIKDNGKGFNVKRVLHTRWNNRLGMLGMRERVEMIGGRFDVESAPGKGTTIRAHIPLGKAARGKTRR